MGLNGMRLDPPGQVTDHQHEEEHEGERYSDGQRTHYATLVTVAIVFGQIVHALDEGTYDNEEDQEDRDFYHVVQSIGSHQLPLYLSRLF